MTEGKRWVPSSGPVTQCSALHMATPTKDYMASDASHCGAGPAACSSAALPGICKRAKPLEKNLSVKHLILGNVWTSRGDGSAVCLMRRLERVSVIQETHTSAWYRCTNITPKHKNLEEKESVTYGLETLVFSPWVWSGANVERGQEGEAGEVRQDSLERKFCWTHVENTCSHYFCFVWLLLQADPKYETSDNTLDFFFSKPNMLFFSHWDNSGCVCLWPLSVI